VNLCQVLSHIIHRPVWATKCLEPIDELSSRPSGECIRRICERHPRFPRVCRGSGECEAEIEVPLQLFDYAVGNE
jgi:hypothetical protein